MKMLFNSAFFQDKNIRLWLLVLIPATLFLPILVNNICIAIYIIYWLFFVKKSEKKINFLKNKWLIFFTTSFYILSIISLIYSSDFSSAIFDLEKKMTLVIFPLILLSQKPITKMEMGKITFYFALITTAMCALALVLNFFTDTSLLTNQNLGGLINLHASYFGLYVGFSLFIIIDKMLSKGFSILYSIITLMLIAFIALLAARMIIVGVGVIFFFWFVILKFNTKRLIYGLIGVAIIAGISFNYKPISDRFYEAVNFEDKVELDQHPGHYKTLNRNYGGRALRIAIWTCSLDAVKEHWLIGSGIGDVQEELQKSYKNHAFEFAWHYNSFNTHNMFLQTLISIGIFGLISILYIFIHLGRLSIKKNDFILFSFITLFFFLSLMESTLNVQKGVIFFAFFTSIYTSLYSSKKSK